MEIFSTAPPPSPSLLLFIKIVPLINPNLALLCSLVQMHFYRCLLHQTIFFLCSCYRNANDVFWSGALRSPLCARLLTALQTLSFLLHCNETLANISGQRGFCTSHKWLKGTCYAKIMQVPWLHLVLLWCHNYTNYTITNSPPLTPRYYLSMSDRSWLKRPWSRYQTPTP